MSKRKEIHTIIEGDIYNDKLLPFSNQRTIGMNIVLETLAEIAYELCRQNDMKISSESLFEVKKRALEGGCQFINPIVVWTGSNGETTISIPKDHKEILDGLIKSIQDKSVSGGVITKIKKNDPEKNIETQFKSPLLWERVLKYLKDCGGEASRSNVKKHFQLSTQSLSNILRVLKIGGKIEADNRKNGIIKLV